MDSAKPPRGWLARFLDGIEAVGNRLPDPAILFLWALLLTWVLSAVLATMKFDDIDPRTLGPGKTPTPIQVHNQLTLAAQTTFMTKLVKNFTDFPPLGIVLVVLMGVAIAEHAGLVRAVLRALLAVTPDRLLTPMLLSVAILSHAAGDTGFILVIPLGGVMFAAAGRHPLAGVAAAFAGVSGGFSANVVPSSLDPLLQGFTQAAAQILEPNRLVNPLCNWYFMSAASVLIIVVAWIITDCFVEPRLRGVPVTGDASDAPKLTPLSAIERRGLWAATAVVLLGTALLAAAAAPASSPFRAANGSLTGSGAPLMEMLVPLIFFFFAAPGLAYGYITRVFRSHRDVINGMSQSIGTMSYYLVLAFFAAQFTAAFRDSNVGALLSLKGAKLLQELALSGAVVIIGIILLTTLLDLVIGSASAKWAVMAPILVPMLMAIGFSPELTQAAFRVGASCANIVTPLMPYYPLVLTYCRRYVPSTGVGTLVALMIPYSVCFLVTWTGLLLLWWGCDWPLGLPGG